jgi:electron transfer flavoprotein beta subunit
MGVETVSYTVLVFVKQVPDTQNISGDAMTPEGTVNRAALPAIFNPEDLNALELALQLKDRYGARVVVATMGMPAAAEVLRQSLYRGADEAVLVTDRTLAGADTLATSYTLSCCARKIGNVDLILCGRQAIDGDTAQVGPQIAEHLDIPQITYAAGISYNAENGTLTVKRQFEDRYQTLQVKGLCLITVLSTMVKPRYMNMWDIVYQDAKEIGKITNEDLQLDKSLIGLTGSPTKVKASFTKQLDKTVETLELNPEEAAKAIVDALNKRHLI